MKARLEKSTGKIALVIEGATETFAPISDSTRFDVILDGNALYLIPEGEAEHDAKVERALKRINDKYSRVLRGLA